jgi:AbrB family looped-hinge helix DNA binding protein
MSTTVTLSSKYQIVIPREARQAMNLSSGDELLVLCKPDRVVIMAKPKDFAKRMAGLHREIWHGADAYLRDERESW